MTFFNKIFIATYVYYEQKKNANIRWSATCMYCAIQILFVFLPLLTIKVALQSHFLSSLYTKHKYLYLPIPIIWLFLVWYFYSKDKILKLHNEYDQFSPEIKKIWKWLPFSFLILSVLFFCVLVLVNTHIQHK